MKKSITLLLLIASIFHSKAQTEKEFSLTLNFAVTKYDEGKIMIAIYNSDGTHMEKALKEGSVNVENGEAQFVIEGLASGFYSFSYYYDVNDNNKLDKNIVGVPKEPYGFSNNQKGKFGPPSFEESKILIEKDTTIEINIK